MSGDGVLDVYWRVVLEILVRVECPIEDPGVVEKARAELVRRGVAPVG